MLRRSLARALAPALVLAGFASPAVADDPRVAADFLQGLRDREYFDLALEYLGTLREAPDTPAELKTLIDYEEARCLIGEAARSSDLEAARATLDRAKTKIDAFVKANPNLPQTTEALVELAHLLYERGRIIARIAEEQRTPAEKEARLAEARSTLAAARDAYGLAFDRLDAKFNEFPKFIPDGDPRKIDREKVQTSLMQSELQKSVVDYEIAQAYPPKTPERKQYLDKGLAGFEEIYKRYRTQLVGFTARMWQGKTYEERGELGPAMGIYNELIDHPDPRLRILQKQVDYFRIIVMGKRGEFAKAADESRRWLGMFPKDRRSFEALGVQLELAKSLLAQLPELSEDDQKRATKAAGDALVDVVRYYSPHKPEAVALLKKIRPGSALNASAIANMNYDEAMGQAEQSLSSQEYERAISLFKGAILKADPVRDVAKANKARFNLAFASYMGKRYYESAVIAEHLARRYPSAESSAQGGGDRHGGPGRRLQRARRRPGRRPQSTGRPGEIHLRDLAGDGAGGLRPDRPGQDRPRPGPVRRRGRRVRLAPRQLSQEGRGPVQQRRRPLEARPALAGAGQGEGGRRRDADGRRPPEHRPQGPPRRQHARGRPRPGQYRLRPRRDPAGDRQGPRGPEAARPARQGPGRRRPDARPGHRLRPRPDRDPPGARRHQPGRQGDRRHEVAGGQRRGRGQRRPALLRPRQAPRTRDRGPRQEEGCAGIGADEEGVRTVPPGPGRQQVGPVDPVAPVGRREPAQARQVQGGRLGLRQYPRHLRQGPRLPGEAGANDRLLRAKIKQVAALIGEKKFDEAEKMLDEVIKQNPRALDPQMEMGHLLDAKAEAKKATWAQAQDHWRKLALKLANSKQKPPEYYEAWYCSAVALEKQGKKDLAQQSLASVVRLSNFAGATDMKAKYLETIKRLGK